MPNVRRALYGQIERARQQASQHQVNDITREQRRSPELIDSERAEGGRPNKADLGMLIPFRIAFQTPRLPVLFADSPRYATRLRGSSESVNGRSTRATPPSGA